MQNVILSINPGTTTTRCALYAVKTEGLECVAEQNLDHDEKEITALNGIPNQLEFRATLS